MPRPTPKGGKTSAAKRPAKSGAPKSGPRKPRATGDKPPFRKSSDKPSFGKSSTTRRPSFGKSSDKPSFGKPRFGAKRDDSKPRFGARRDGGKTRFGARDGARPTFRKSTPRAKEDSAPMTLKVSGRESKEIAAAPKPKSYESAPKPEMTLKLSSKETKDASPAPRKKTYERIPKEAHAEFSPRKKSFDKKPFDKKPFGKKSFDKSEKPFDRKRPSFSGERKGKTLSARDAKKPVALKKKNEAPAAATSSTNDDGTQRLNKFLASAGVASRRKADELIEQGAVAINGKVITELGTKVRTHEDRVTVNGEIVSIPHKFLYLLLNKPKDTITTTSDERDRSTVLDYVKTEERVYPVGRLDRNTTGVLLLTNDGDLTNALTHPSFEIEREYHVTIDKALESDDARKIADGGVNIGEGDITGPAGLSLDPKNRKDVILTLREGKNREVRRLFETLGYEVEKLDRIRFASLTHRGMKRGDVRPLTNSEVHALKRLAGLES